MSPLAWMLSLALRVAAWIRTRVLAVAAWIYCRAYARTVEPLVDAWGSLCRLRDRWRLSWTDEEMERELGRAEAIRKGEDK
jgi:hypothetical protein